MSSLLLRRKAMFQAKLDEYEDCVFGAVVANNVAILCPLCMTGYVEIPSDCAGIKVKMANTHHMYNGKCILYNSQKAASATKTITNSSNTLTFTITAGSYAYIRANFDIDEIDDCYIKDNTNNTYLWKGKNVT